MYRGLRDSRQYTGYNSIEFIFLLCILYTVYCLLSLSGCGNPEEDRGSPPQLSSLNIQSPLIQSQSGRLVVHGTVQFIDSDRDVVGIRIFTRNSESKEFVLKKEDDLSQTEGVNGQPSGQITITFVIDTNPPSLFRVRVIAFDSKGNNSDPREMDIIVCPSESAAAECVPSF